MIVPDNPRFSSGPCAKRPGWSLDVLADATVGRLHRSQAASTKVAAVIDETRALLKIPDDYRIGVVAGSDTGAFEISMWSLLGHESSVAQVEWPVFNQILTQTEELLIVVQVNGKVRQRIVVPTNASQEDIKNQALNDAKVERQTKGKEIQKVIMVPGKLVNIVVK